MAEQLFLQTFPKFKVGDTVCLTDIYGEKTPNCVIVELHDMGLGDWRYSIEDDEGNDFWAIDEKFFS